MPCELVKYWQDKTLLAAFILGTAPVLVDLEVCGVVVCEVSKAKMAGVPEPFPNACHLIKTSENGLLKEVL